MESKLKGLNAQLKLEMHSHKKMCVSVCVPQCKKRQVKFTSGGCVCVGRVGLSYELKFSGSLMKRDQAGSFDYKILDATDWTLN